jgi:cell division protein FtsI/penicillin-binding protein 2
LVGTLLATLALVLVVQLVQVQVVNHRFYADWAREQRERPIAMADSPRGVIRDRNGHLLVGNSVRYSIEADTVYVVDAPGVALALGPLLHVPVAQIEQWLRSDALWVQIAPSVSKEVGEQIAAMGLRGITVRPSWEREYPEGGLASHVLGFCNGEGEGFYGVEGFHDGLLRPRQVTWEGPVDPASEQVPWTVSPVVLPQPGTELILTLDRTVQALAEQELARSVQEYGARGGTIIVMDPRSFEILALASLPNYDPGRYGDFYALDPLPFDDPSVSQQYEPGSVFKIVTLAAALDAGVVTPEMTYYDQGWIEVGGATIENSSLHEHREYTVSEMLIYSLNVGTAWLNTQMGPDLFYRYVLAFGFGRPTEVDLEGEAAGQLWLPDDLEHWHDSNLGTNSFGQGLAVTPIQMVSAVATVANDGARLRPHIVAQRIVPDGALGLEESTLTFHPEVEAQVISPQTARTLTEMLVRAVDEGVSRAQIPGYRVAGKTGTAQIPVPGGYDKTATIVSFAGFAPASDPQLVILVKLDRPTSSSWASDTAALTFQRLASRLFVVLGIPPDRLEVAEAVAR